MVPQKRQYTQVISPHGSTLQCHRWLRDDMLWNSPKRLPCWNFTSGFDFDHIIAVKMSFCMSLRNPNRTTCQICHLEFQGSNDGLFEKPLQVINKDHSAKLHSFCENRVFCIFATDRQTNKQMDSIDALSRSRSRKRQLNNIYCSIAIVMLQFLQYTIVYIVRALQ